MNPVDAHFDNGKNYFRIRSCGIIINNNQVLMVKNNKDDYLFSVGGAIHLGETIEDACVRELKEETGYSYEIDRLLFVHEDFFTMNNRPFHEIAFYFLMKPNNATTFTQNSIGFTGAKEEMVWIPLESFNQYKAYPSFFGEELTNLSLYVKHIVTKEKNT